MHRWLTTGLVLAAGLAGARSGAAAAQPADTATVRFHISGMTCGSCPTTARVALQKLPGVQGATVTLADSLGVVRYDPARVTPAQIAAHLARLTGFTARVLPDSLKPRAGGRGAAPSRGRDG